MGVVHGLISGLIPFRTSDYLRPSYREREFAMPITTALFSLVPVLALTVGYLSKGRLTNGDVLMVTLLAQLSMIVESMFSSERERLRYIGDLTGVRRVYAALVVGGTVAVAACAAFDVPQPTALLSMTLVFVGQFMLGMRKARVSRS